MFKLFGFYQEHGYEGHVSLHSESAGTKTYDLEAVLAYLSMGQVFLASAGIEEDMLSKGGKKIGAGTLKTDGTWIWPNYVEYYIANYKIGVPEELLEHIRRFKQIERINGKTIDAACDFLVLNNVLSQKHETE